MRFSNNSKLRSHCCAALVMKMLSGNYSHRPQFACANAGQLKGWEPDWTIPQKLQFRKIDLNILRAYKNVINSKDIYTTAVKVCTCTHRSIKRINILRAYKNVINSKDIYTTAVKVCTCTHRSIKRIMNTNTAKITNRQKRQKHYLFGSYRCTFFIYRTGLRHMHWHYQRRTHRNQV